MATILFGKILIDHEETWKYTRAVRKVPDFFCKNLVDFNEVRLHEATLNLHTHAWILSRLPIAPVDGKQHLSEVVFSALVGFSLYEVC